MSKDLDLLSCFPDLFKRITLDEIDIIAKGETPKHDYFIYLEDIPKIKYAIKEMTEKDAMEFIATRIHKVT